MIEDNRLLREGIKALLLKQPDVKAVDAFAESRNAILKAAKLKPDLVLLDFGLGNHNCLRAVQSLKRRFPKAHVVVMEFGPMHEDVVDLVKAGAAGFIFKEGAVNDFMRTIRLVAQGGKVLPSKTESLLSRVIEHALRTNNRKEMAKSIRLSEREREIVELIAQGMGNKEIAQKLHISTHTVKTHVHNVLEKLALHTRLEIAAYFHGLQTSETQSVLASRAGDESLVG